jgi:hypothetical protein
MDFATQAQAQILPLIADVLETMSNPEDAAPIEYFGRLLAQAHAMKTEEDVLGLFMELSTVAFHEFPFTPHQAKAVDELLLEAEFIAFTMTADGRRPH